MVDPYIEIEEKNLTQDDIMYIKDNIIYIIGEIRYLYSLKYKEFLKYKTFNVLFQKYYNQLIRSKDELNQDYDEFEENFINFVKLEKSENIVKKILDFIMKNQDVIINIITIIIRFVEFKKKILLILNNFTTLKSYVELKSGEIKHINQEGFVISFTDGRVTKLVDREEFSYLNFSQDVVKGWK
jgi:hypothetical protein